MWSAPATISEEKTDFDQNLEYYEELEKKSVKCTCPKCGITHVLKFLWTGKGTPRKYCHRCREALSGINDQCIYESIPDAFRYRQSSMHTGD
jgi:transposase-like protein